MFDPSHVTWMGNILVPAVYTLTLLFKGLTLKRNSLDTDVKTMTRTGNPKELLLGPIHFTITMCIVGIWFFRKEEAIIIMSCLGFGDGIAPLVGQYYPFLEYPTYPFGMNDKKTFSGSLAFFIGSICGFYCLKGAATETTLQMNDLIKIAATATVAEGLTGPYDNIVVVLTAFACYKYL